ncbi:MAG: hypothetical protein ACI33P_05730 [Lysinibacillus sp.]
MAASISSALFSVLFAFMGSNPFSSEFATSFLTGISIVLTYTFPIVFIYGVLTSFVSDAVARLATRRIGNRKDELLISGVLHAFFGLPFFYFGLFAALLFFAADKLLERRQPRYHWLQGAKWLLMPIGLWLLSSGIAWLNE